MRRQIGFEIRDMWYNLGNLTNILFILFSFSWHQRQLCCFFPPDEDVYDCLQT